MTSARKIMRNRREPSKTKRRRVKRPRRRSRNLLLTNTMIDRLTNGMEKTMAGHFVLVLYQRKWMKQMKSLQLRRGNRKGYSAWEMKDHCRTKVELKSWDQIPEFIGELGKKKIPFSVEAVGPTQWGYQGLHITWRNQSGISNEVQLTTKLAWETKLWSDHIYEKWRNVNVDEASREKRDEFLVDLKKSKQRWNQLSLPDFSIYASNSDAFSTRELYVSDAATGDTGRTSLPSISSKNITSDSPVITNTLPVSDKKKSIAKPPYMSSIAQDSDSVKQEFSVAGDEAELDGGSGRRWLRMIMPQWNRMVTRALHNTSKRENGWPGKRSMRRQRSPRSRSSGPESRHKKRRWLGRSG